MSTRTADALFGLALVGTGVVLGLLLKRVPLPRIEIRCD